MGKKTGNSVVELGEYVVDEIKKMVDEGWHRPVWHTISALPKDTCFESQTEKEKVLLLMRAHPATNLWWIAVVAMLIGVPLFWGDFPLIFTQKLLLSHVPKSITTPGLATIFA